MKDDIRSDYIRGKTFRQRQMEYYSNEDRTPTTTMKEILQQLYNGNTDNSNTIH